MSVFHFVDTNAWHLGELVDLDIMVTRNFISINEGIKSVRHNSVINAHLERPKLKNTTYSSPHVQNEIINIGKNIIKKYLVDKIRSANNFLIMVDEIASFNKEVIHLCVQFVNHDIRKDFFFFLICKIN